MTVDRSLRLAHQIAAAPRIAVHVDPETGKIRRHFERVELLEKYLGREDVFGTFTSIQKLGIYPGTPYKTPVGIYAYPLDFIYGHYDDESGEFQVPFPPVPKQDFLQIFEVTNMDRCLVFDSEETAELDKFKSADSPNRIRGVIDFTEKLCRRILRYYKKNLHKVDFSDSSSIMLWLSDPINETSALFNEALKSEIDLMGEIRDFFAMPKTLSEFQSDFYRSGFRHTEQGRRLEQMQKVGDVPGFKEFLSSLMARLEETADPSLESQFPYEDRVVALFRAVRGADADYGEFQTEVMGSDQRVECDQAYVWNASRILAGESAQRWNSYLIKLGFIGAIDHGTNTIHPNEPTQVVFFSKEFVRLLEFIQNRPQQFEHWVPYRQQLYQWSRRNDPRHLGADVRNRIDLLLTKIGLGVSCYQDAIEMQEEFTGTYTVKSCLLNVKYGVNELYKYMGWIISHQDRLQDSGLDWEQLFGGIVDRIDGWKKILVLPKYGLVSEFQEMIREMEHLLTRFERFR